MTENREAAMQAEQEQLNTQPAGKPKKNRSKAEVLIWIVLGILAVLLILSAIVLTLRLVEYAKVDDRALSIDSNMDEVFDVFAIEYKNDLGEVSIQGADGDKVLAPGASIEYTIRLRNKDKIAIDYTLAPSVSYLSDIVLPIEVRLIGPGEGYIVGSATEWVPMERLNDIQITHTLPAGEFVEYYFQWRWPFESGDDAYDTWLGGNAGDVAVGADLDFSMHATANLDADLNGGWFAYRTPDVILVLIFIILLLLAITLLIIRLLQKMREKAPEPIIITVKEPVPMPEPEPIPEPEPEPEPAPIPELAPIQISYALTGRMSIINLDDLEMHYESGEEITLESLKQKGLLPKRAKYLKVLADINHPLQKAWIVRTHRVSAAAKKAILEAGGEIHIIKE